MQPELQQDSVLSRLRGVLTEPSAAITDRADRRTARLLSTLLLCIAPLGLLSFALQWIDAGRLEGSHIAIVLAVLAVGLTYLLSRTPYFRIAGAVTTLIPTIGSLGVFAADTADPGWFAFMALNPALGTLLLRIRFAFALAVVNVAAVVLAVVIASDVDADTMVVAIGFNTLVAAVVLIAALHRSGVERDRRSDLIARQQLQESILAGTFGGIAVVRNGIIAETNELFTELFGARGDDLLATRAEDLFAEESVDAFAGMMNRADGKPIEIVAIRRDGTQFNGEVLVRRATEVDDGDRVVAVRDITERKVSERALLHAQRMESVGRLAAGIAHDTNNELLVIMGYAEQLMRQQTEYGQPTESVERINGAAERVATLIRRVLLVGRDRVDEPTDVDVNDFVAESEPLWRQIVGRTIDVDVITSGSRAVVLVDRAHLEQLLLNLVLNARDAMDGIGRLRIEVEPVEFTSPTDVNGVVLPPGRYQRIAVTDSGHGIAADHLETVFDPFFTTKDDGLGTGLGLFTSKQIVLESGGAISVESDRDHTTFRLVFPDRAPA